MRRERIENWPVPHVSAIADKGRVDPFQRLAQSLRPALLAHRAAGEILHEAMHDEARRAAVLRGHARNERIGVEAAARLIGVSARRLAGNGDVEERIRNRVGREKGEPVEQPPALRRELRDRCRPGRGQRPIGTGHRRIRPGERFFPALAPELQVASKADAIGRDMRARLLQTQRQAAKLPRQRPRQRRVVLALGAVRFGSVEQELRGRALFKNAEFELSKSGGKIRRPRGDDDMPAFKTRHEFRHLGNGGGVVDVVEDHQPCRVQLEPAQDGGDLGRVVARLFLRQVENLEGRQPRQTRVERGAVVRADEQKRGIDRLARPRIFDREPRLADPSETRERDRSALGAEERRMQVGKVLLAPGEQAAEGREAKIARLR